MELIHGYKTSKQNSALLEIFTKSFPGNVQITQGLEQLLNKNESTIARLKNDGKLAKYHFMTSNPLTF